jgi:glycerol uptake facilitator protein
MISAQGKAIVRECVAEAAGTFILVLFGAGAVHAAAFTGAQGGLWEVGVVWGLAVGLAVYTVGAISGAHINPAITVAFAAFRKFPVRKVGPYVLSQVVGAFLAAALLHALYGGVISRFEASHDLVRGQPGSERSAMAYGEYFPCPALRDPASQSVSLAQATLAEGVGTALLALFVFAVTDRGNPGRPGGTLPPLFIGLSVAVIISVIAPLTQAGLNPARDFGPRLFAYLAGWGAIAIPGPRGGFFTVYILAPVVGALVGSASYQFVLRPGMPKADSPELAGGERTS